MKWESKDHVPIPMNCIIFFLPFWQDGFLFLVWDLCFISFNFFWEGMLRKSSHLIIFFSFSESCADIGSAPPVCGWAPEHKDFKHVTVFTIKIQHKMLLHNLLLTLQRIIDLRSRKIFFTWEWVISSCQAVHFYIGCKQVWIWVRLWKRGFTTAISRNWK